MPAIRNLHAPSTDTDPIAWDTVADVVVVGSGGGALVAATLAADAGSSVVLLEKDEVIGGTTGVSGGAMWLPGNPHVTQHGETDSREDAIAYLEHLSRGAADPDLLEAFVDAAPEMLRYLEDNTPLQTQAIAHFPDYYHDRGDVPGSKGPGRTVEPLPFAVRTEMPDWADRIAVRATMRSLGSRTTLAEERARRFAGEPVREDVERETADIRVKGAALVGRLLKGLLERNVDIRTGHAASGLVMRGDEAIGVRASTSEGEVLIGARRGVVLACGGFEWNPELVRAFIGYDVRPVSPPSNTGDGLLMLMQAGAELGNMTSYWGTTVSYDPDVLEDDGTPAAQFGTPARGKPASLIVNRLGHRFGNEALPYNDFPKLFGAADPSAPGYANDGAAWLVFDRKARDESAIFSVQPGDPAPDWLHPSASIGELAERIGLDPSALTASVERFNADAASGADSAFGRTDIQPIEDAPFHALAVEPGTLGTNGGARITADGQVRRSGGGLIDGLYAVGNTSAAAFGFLYPSGGGPIGLSCTFGYRAGRHVGSVPTRTI